MNFHQLFREWNWRPIAGCPGRFVLRDAPGNLSIEEILGRGGKAIELSTPRARDTVLVSSFEGGGLISYRREDGSYLHTLNTEEGLTRKLAQLEVDLRSLAQRGD